MITELSPEEFFKVAPLLDGDRTNLEVKAVVEGYNPGWIFVNQTDSPTTALVWSKGIEGFYFLGSADSNNFNATINSYIDENIAPRAKALGLTHFEFSATSHAWDQIIPELFKDRKLTTSKQLVYRKNMPSNPVNYASNDPRYQLLPVNQKLLSDPLLDTQYLESAILEWWDSVETFLNKGIGYAVFFDKKAVCTCVTSFMNKTIMESHIQTNPAHQKMGLASWAVQTFVDTALEKGYSLYWDCMETNLGSRALAKKMHYHLLFDYPLYEFPFPESVNHNG